MSQIIAFLVPVVFLILAAWKRTGLFYTAAGFSWVLYGFNYSATNGHMAILLVIVGIACFGGAIWDKG